MGVPTMLRLLLPLVLLLAAFIGSGNIIHACVHNAAGTVRIVVEGTACPAGETAIEWGVVGLQRPKDRPAALEK